MLLGVGLALALLAGAVVVLRWREARKEDRRAAERLPELRAEAFKAAKLCDDVDESLMPTIAILIR